MASVQSKTNVKLDELIGATVVSGRVDSIRSQLILTTRAGADILAGLLELKDALAQARYELRPIFEAFAKRNYERTVMVALGDSRTEGTLLMPPNYSRRWFWLAQEAIRSRLNIDESGVGYIPIDYADGLTTDDVVRTGNMGAFQSFIWGAGGRARLLPGTTGNEAVATWPTLPCTKVRVWYGKNNFLAGSFKVFIDGVDVTSSGTLGGNGTSGASGANVSCSSASKSGGYYWESADLTAGDHTLAVKGTINGFSAVVSGAEFFNGDEATGLVFMDWGHSGAKVSNFIASSMDPAWDDYETQAPLLTTIELGANDWSTVSAATHESEVTTLLEKCVAGSPNGIPLVLNGVKPGACPQATWDDYRDAKIAAVEAVPGAVFFDMTPHWPVLEEDGSTNNGLFLESTNPLHPNSSGHQRWADIISMLLMPY